MTKRSRPDSLTKICTEDGCARYVRARGVCSMHYRRQFGHRTRYTIICVTCSSEYQSARPDGKYCSEVCRDYDKWGPRYEPWPRKVRHKQPKPPPPPPTYTRSCEWCGSEFTTTRSLQRFCCGEHGNRMGKVRRRGREYAANGAYTWSEVTKVWLTIGRRCAYCSRLKRNDEIEPDHVVPLSKGGSNSIHNIVPSCSLCNSDKRDLSIPEWVAERERLGKAPLVLASGLGHLTYEIVRRAA